MFGWLPWIALAAISAFIATGLAAYSGPLQAPNGRSSHTSPTPLGGGLGVAVGVCLCVVAAAGPLGTWLGVMWDADAARRLAAILAVAGLIGAVGAVDDVIELGARGKFLVLAGLSLLMAWVAGPAAGLAWLGGEALPIAYPLAILGSALWVFTVVNAVNFMDGANGLAGGAGLLAALGLAGAGALWGAPAVTLAALALAAALGGFLPWNARRRAWVFLGDSGALFLGAIFAGLALMLLQTAPVGAVYLAPVLIMPLLADVLLTLADRARRGAPMLEGHRDHAYQRALRRGVSHGVVARNVWLQTALCVLTAWGAVVISQWAGPWAFLAAFGVSALWASIAVSPSMTTLVTRMGGLGGDVRTPARVADLGPVVRR